MVKLIVVAGASSKKLAEFFDKRGTFEIEFVYENLTDNLNQIQNKVVVADKLLYLYNDSEEQTINIKSDMQILGNLLKNDSFFKPGEIVFMTSNSEQAKLATKFFVTVMEDCNKTDYSIKTVVDKMSFAAIYNLLMGTTNTADFKNTYTTLYKVERDAEADTEYVPKNDKSLSIEPFNFGSVTTYQDKQAVSKKVDTGTVYNSSPDTALPKIDSFQFDPIKIDKVDKKSRKIIISGLPMSGKSMWAAQLAISAKQIENSVCVVDFTKKANLSEFFSKANVQINELSFLEMLHLDSVQPGITYIAPSSEKELKVKNDALALFLHRSAEFSTIVVVCELSDANNIRRLFLTDVDLLFTSNATLEDIGITSEFMPMFDEKTRSTLILNRISDLEDNYMSAEEVRSIMPESLRIVKDMKFTNFDMKGSLYKAMFGNN